MQATRTININVIKEMMCNNGDSLKAITDEHPVMLVFLRHFGCVFCKEALSDLADSRASIESMGTRIVFVHMAPDLVADNYFKRYKLEGCLHISNPSKSYYVAFGLMKGKISQLYGLRTWIRGYEARKEGHELELAQELGDSTQMPGIFAIHADKIIDSYIHKNASERPDYHKFAEKCCNIQNKTTDSES